MKPLRCEFCNGNLVMDDSREFAVCEFCGTKYMKSTLQSMIQEIKGNVTIDGDVSVKQTDFAVRAKTLEKYNGADDEVFIPDSINIIGPYAFKNCIGLKSIAFSSSVKAIEAEAFAGCTGLEKVTLPSNLKRIGEKAFMGCIKLQSIALPKSVTHVQTKAFKNCTGIKEVIIYNPKMQIDDEAFGDCIHLTNVRVPKTTKYHDIAFNYYNVFFHTSFLWKRQGLCPYCGGSFKGVINKTCKLCGKAKDY